MLTIQDCEELRREIKRVADRFGGLRAQPPPYNAEAVENMTLAYRHLENASMRLGKAIQALDGGVSVYDRTQVPGA